MSLKDFEKNNVNKLTRFTLISTVFNKIVHIKQEDVCKRFLERYINENEKNREEIREGLYSSRKIVEIIGGFTDDNTKSNISSCFNTPFNPQVLITNKTMQEGKDLQQECRIIINYDLEWNPATLEQRIGRIDRIGSLVSRLGKDEKLFIYYPYIKNTIDEKIYKTVKNREKRFNLILGGSPQWETFNIDETNSHIGKDVYESLQINLGVDEQ